MFNRRHMKFGVPMIWRKPFCHSIDCYFCLSKQTGIGKNMRWHYAHVESVTFPIPHSDTLPIPTCPGSSDLNLCLSSQEETTTVSEFEPSQAYRRLLTQPELNDWVRDLELPKDKAELHASRMKQFNFLAPNVKVTHYRDRDKPYSKYFMRKGQICFCINIPGLFMELGQPYDAAEWRLFIDSSKDSLKAVLLHFGNVKPSIPIGHAVNTKESYKTMVELLKCINYEKHNWKVCADLKVVGMLRGMQGGFTKYCCFLCLWDSRARTHHYTRKIWPERRSIIVGKDNVAFKALVKKENIILPPLHIKLGLFKNFVKSLDKEGRAFAYLRLIFPRLSDAKIKEGIFDGPQIRKVLKDEQFSSLLLPNDAAAWKSFQMIVSNFLGNNKRSNYKKNLKICSQIMQKWVSFILINIYIQSLKINFLPYHLNFVRRISVP